MAEQKKELNESELDNIKKVLAELEQKIKNLVETLKKNNDNKGKIEKIKQMNIMLKI